MIIDRVSAEDRSEQMAHLAERVWVLFERLPMLCGFHVNEDLALTEITVAQSGLPVAPEMSAAISTELEEILDDVEGSVELIRGMTIARAIH